MGEAELVQAGMSAGASATTRSPQLRHEQAWSTTRVTMGLSGGKSM
jgi:hypothetical protein